MRKSVVSVLVLAALGLLQVEAYPYWNEETAAVQVPLESGELVNCAAVLCAFPNCPKPVTPKGQCCPVCPKVDCRQVLCPDIACLDAVIPEGKCCPKCPGYTSFTNLRAQGTTPEPEPGSCPIEGQIYHDCGTACPPTCADPFPSCTRQCVAGCQCPSGTVLDAAANQCVPLKECTCPPDCTHDFCSNNPKALCNVPGPREIPGCFGGQCQLTFCPACYYSKETRDLPGNCKDCDSPVTSLKCLKNWATCIHIADIWQNGWDFRRYSITKLDDRISPDPSITSQDYFKCYRYPCMLRG